MSIFENNVPERVEFQMRSALDRLRKKDRSLELVMDSQRFEVSLPCYYLETYKNSTRVKAFARTNDRRLNPEYLGQNLLHWHNVHQGILPWPYIQFPASPLQGLVVFPKHWVLAH